MIHMETWKSTDAQEEVHHFIKKDNENGKTYIFGVNPQIVSPTTYKHIRYLISIDLAKYEHVHKPD